MKKGGKRRLDGSAQLGQQLRGLRLEKNLTQRELAGLVDVSPAHVSAIETGKVTNPGIELIQRIAAVLDANVLLGGGFAQRTASPTLAYESPFDLRADPTGVIQTALHEISDLLEDRTIPAEERVEIAKRMLSYAKWQHDHSGKDGTSQP